MSAIYPAVFDFEALQQRLQDGVKETVKSAFDDFGREFRRLNLEHNATPKADVAQPVANIDEPAAAEPVTEENKLEAEAEAVVVQKSEQPDEGEVVPPQRIAADMRRMTSDIEKFRKEFRGRMPEMRSKQRLLLEKAQHAPVPAPGSAAVAPVNQSALEQDAASPPDAPAALAHQSQNTKSKAKGSTQPSQVATSSGSLPPNTNGNGNKKRGVETAGLCGGGTASKKTKTKTDTNTAVTLIAPPSVPTGQCKGVTSKNHPCRGRAKAGASHCHSHGDQAPVTPQAASANSQTAVSAILKSAQVAAIGQHGNVDSGEEEEEEEEGGGERSSEDEEEMTSIMTLHQVKSLMGPDDARS